MKIATLTAAEEKMISRAASDQPTVWSYNELKERYLRDRRKTKLTHTQLKRLLRAASGKHGIQQNIIMTMGRVDRRISRSDFRQHLKIYKD